MIIYEFTTFSFQSNKPFVIKEIEVEEKPKTYIGKGCRINKDDIGLLQSSFGNKMYLLENKPEIYINAMIERHKNNVRVSEIRLSRAKELLSAWSALAERKE